jgi:Mn2+/Fe2+ NRAMP family transporter
MILSLLAAIGILFTGVDPVQLTEFSVVFSAIALPLTYLPILIVANDPGYMGDQVNGKVTNFFGLVFLGIVLLASIAAIPLMIISGAGA